MFCCNVPTVDVVVHFASNCDQWLAMQPDHSGVARLMVTKAIKTDMEHMRLVWWFVPTHHCNKLDYTSSLFNNASN